MEQYLTYLLKHNSDAFYLFDIAKLKERIRWLRKHLPQHTRLCYAVKANPFVIQELTDEVERFECCSPGEARICNSLSMNKEKLVISGVYKTPKVMESIIADASFNGVFTVESLRQYTLLIWYAQKHKASIKVLLRLTNNSQFGLNSDDIEEIIKDRGANPYVHILGIQYFSGTQKTSLKKIQREIGELDDFITDLNNQYGFVAEELEYGPGFPVSYFTGEAFEEEAFFNGFCEIIASMKNKPVITLELGRSIAASCGTYYTHIVDMKTNSGQNYLLVDGGMHQLVYFGQYMAMKQPFISVVGELSASARTEWTICGALCSMNDILAKNILLPSVKIGDVLCFENTGAYCMSEGPALFLSRELPALYLRKENGELYCVRKPIETEIFNVSNYERMN